MKKISARFVLVLLGNTLLCAAASAQEPSHGDRCEGPVYKQAEVSRRPVIKHKPDPGFTEEARANNVSGTVSLAAVLCHTGRVTDIRVLKELPYGLTEMSVAAASRVEFAPAEKDGRRVATHVRFEYNFNTVGDGALARPGDSDDNRSPAPLSDKHDNRLVEDVSIEGNRRLRDEEIYNHISTRPGAPFDAEQVQRDLQALLDLALFDKTETRVLVEEGLRGGVRVVFHVAERPIIRDLSFEGLRDITEFEVLKALRENDAGVCKQCPYDPVKAVEAARVIRKLLVERGWPDAKVGVRVDEVSSVSVALSFVVVEP